MSGLDEASRGAPDGAERDRVVCVVVGGDPFDEAGPLSGLRSRGLDVRRAGDAVDAMRVVVEESVVGLRPLVLLVCEPDAAEHRRLVAAVREHAPRAVVRLQRGERLERPESDADGPPPGGSSGQAEGVIGGIVLDDAEIALLRAVWAEGSGEELGARAGLGRGP